MTVSLAYLHTRTLMASALANMVVFWRAESEPRFLMKSGQWLSHEIYEMSHIYIYIHIIYTSYYIPRDVLITWQSSTTWWRTTHAIRLHGLVQPQWKRRRYPLGISRNPFPRSYSTPPQRNHALVVTARSSAAGWWFGTCLFSHILGKIIPTDFHIFRGVGIPPSRYRLGPCN